MRDVIRWGILSTANIGRKQVAPAIQRSRNGTVVAVASRDVGAAQAYSEELGIERYYGSYEALVADDEIDAIYIPLPNHLHAEWSIRCAEAGKPVLCEKPLASNANEAQRMVDVFRERDILFGEAFMYRHHPKTLRVKELLQKGVIGEIHFIESSFTFQLRNNTNIRLRADMAGGSLMDVGCYCINAIRYFAEEEPDEVHAIARFGEISGVDEFMVGALRFPSGVLAHFDSGLRTPRKHSYEIRGSEGRIVVDEAFTVPAKSGTAVQLWRGSAAEEIRIPPVDHYQLMVENFADALLTGVPLQYPIQDAVATMRVIDRLMAVARS